MAKDKIIDSRLLAQKTLKAIKMCELGARPPVLVFILEDQYISSAKANRIYREVNQVNAPSGQLPRASDYFVRNLRVNLHSTWVYQTYRELLADKMAADDAFIAAYEMYRNHFGSEAKLSINRLWSLLLSVEKSKELRLVCCDACAASYLLRRNEFRNAKYCPFCKSNTLMHLSKSGHSEAFEDFDDVTIDDGEAERVNHQRPTDKKSRRTGPAQRKLF